MRRSLYFLKLAAVYGLRRGHRKKLSVLRSYLTISLIDGLGLQRRSLTLFGASFAFPDAFDMRFLIEEVILGRHYAVWPPRTDAPIIIDAGANVGMASLYFKRLFSDAHVISLEPHPVNVGYLRSNVSSAQLLGIEVVERALTADGRTTWMSGENMTASLTDVHDVGSVSVRSIPLSSLFHDTKSIDILKLDIEGAELEVLRSVASDLSRIDQIIVEIHLSDAHGDPLPEILEILQQGNHRYEIRYWTADTQLTTCIVRSWRKTAGHPAGDPVYL